MDKNMNYFFLLAKTFNRFMIYLEACKNMLTKFMDCAHDTNHNMHSSPQDVHKQLRPNINDIAFNIQINIYFVVLLSIKLFLTFIVTV